VGLHRFTTYLALGALFCLGSLSAQTASPPLLRGKSADEIYRNIQILKSVPADEVLPSMQFMSSSLGVHCEHCHIEGAFDKDDKKPKQQARDMMKMVSTLNRINFAGQPGITCFTCHRGALRPRRTPAVLETSTRPAFPNVATGTSASRIIDRYLEAVGGVAALQRVSSLTKKGTIELGAGITFPIQIALKQPDLRCVHISFPNGESDEVEKGGIGWSLVPGRPLHEMSKEEAASARVDADPSFVSRLKETFVKLEVRPDVQIGDNTVAVLRASKSTEAPVRLYFDKKSGLLVRLVRYVNSPLGRNPTQIDYSDYREVAGMRLPFRWTVAQPQGHFTVQLSEVQVNVPIDDSRFAKPTAEISAGGD